MFFERRVRYRVSITECCSSGIYGIFTSDLCLYSVTPTRQINCMNRIKEIHYIVLSQQEVKPLISQAVNCLATSCWECGDTGGGYTQDTTPDQFELLLPLHSNSLLVFHQAWLIYFWPSVKKPYIFTIILVNYMNKNKSDIEEVYSIMSCLALSSLCSLYLWDPHSFFLSACLTCVQRCHLVVEKKKGNSCGA